MHPFPEEIIRILKGLTLHILGRLIQTAPQSAVSVSTRMAFTMAGISCSGREIRSQYFTTGRKQSEAVMVRSEGTSIC